MRHAYVVFDNDAPLFVCFRREQAEAIVRREYDRLRTDLLGSLDRVRDTMAPAQYVSEQHRAEEQFGKHFLHYHIVPFDSPRRNHGS